MSNRGRPSTGCRKCLERHIKCDETKPNCLHCVKKGVPCPGYPAWTDIAWKSQNVQAAKMVRRRAKVSAKDKSLSHLAIPPNDTEPTSQVPRILPQDFEMYAMNFFLDHYIVLPNECGAQLSYLECVYPLWTTMKKSSPLRHALAAVASFMLEAWSELTPNVSLSWSRAHYLHALVALRCSLESKARVTDDVLLASLMLDMYENLSSWKGPKVAKSPHVNGMMALASSQNGNLAQDHISHKLLLSVREQAVQRSIDHQEVAPSQLISLAIPTDLMPKTPKTQLDSIHMEVAQLYADCPNFHDQRSQTAFESKLTNTNLLERAIALDTKCEAWMAEVPESWRSIQVLQSVDIPREVKDAGMYGEECIVYKDIFVAHAFNRNECLRIRLQILILRCISILRDERLLPYATVAEAKLQTSADRMCKSVPYMLGDRIQPDRIDIDHQYPRSLEMPDWNHHHHYKLAAAFGGWFLAPVLGFLLSPNVKLRPGQQQWVKGQMERLQKIYVIRTAPAD